ncbi:hypothetical protein GOODEAATRI_011891, partial [Goodea atripinnis]
MGLYYPNVLSVSVCLHIFPRPLLPYVKRHESTGGPRRTCQTPVSSADKQTSVVDDGEIVTCANHDYATARRTMYKVERRPPRCSQNESPLKRPFVKHKYWVVFGLYSCFYFRLAEAALTAGVVRSPAGWSLFEHEQQHRAGRLTELTKALIPSSSSWVFSLFAQARRSASHFQLCFSSYLLTRN